MTASSLAAEELCHSLGLRLIEILPAHGGQVLRVADDADRELLLKRAVTQPHAMDEAEALALWADRACVPALVRVYPEGTHLRQFVRGQPLTTLPSCGSERAREMGMLLAKLHGPRSCHDVGAGTSWLEAQAEQLQQSGFLANALRLRAAELTRALAAEPASTVVHGDFYHRNILQRDDGTLAVIDPLARPDLPAVDVGMFVLTTPAPDPRAIMAEVVEGYGSAPVLLDEYVEWLAIRNRHHWDIARSAGLLAAWTACFIAADDGSLQWQQPR